MFRYRLHSPDGDDLGEATYAMMIKPGEEIIAGNGRRFASSPSSRSRRRTSRRSPGCCGRNGVDRGRQAPEGGGRLRPMAASAPQLAASVALVASLAFD
jgi:hypothetical protein